MQPEYTLTHLQVSVNCPYSEPAQSSPTSWRSILTLSSNVRLGLSSSRIPRQLATLTYSMEQSPSSEANQSLQLVKKFPTFLWNPKVLYCTHKSPPPVPILSRLYPVPTTHSNLLKAGHTAQIIIHIYPQPRYCLSRFWAKHDPLMMAMNCWNMLG
jgi:hypothetical protein